MLVVAAIFEIHIEYAQSLKEKRMVVKSLRDKLRSHFEISASEVAFQDLHQRSRIAIAFVTGNGPTADALLDKIHSFVETNTDAVLAGWMSEKLEFDELITLC